MFGSLVNQSTMSGRRNAMRPDDVENLLRNQHGSALNPKNHMIQRLLSERQLSPPRKRARPNEDDCIAITSKKRPSSEISQPKGVTPLTIPIPNGQQAISYKNDPSIVLDWQSNPLEQKRQVGKRKRAAISYDEDYYESQPFFLDVIHPSEIKLSDGNTDEQRLATMENDFMKEGVRVRSTSAHNSQINEAPQSKGGLSSNCVSPTDTSFNSASHDQF